MSTNYRRHIAPNASSFIFWVIILFLFSGFISSAHGELEEGFIRDVRTFDLEFLDISSPAGLAFSPKNNKLFVTEAAKTPETTEIKAISLTEDKLFSTELPVVLSNPAHIAFNSKSRELRAFEPDNEQLIGFKESQDGQLDETISNRVSLTTSAVPRNPQGMDIDQQNGRIFFLDPDNLRIVSVDSTGSSASTISLKRTGQTDFEAIALDPVSKHPFVLSSASQQLFEITRNGSVENVFDLSGFRLRNPQSMVFAPSGDLTDDPSIQHLYIADSGDPPSSPRDADARNSVGQILEVSFTPVPAFQAAASGCVATVVRDTDTSLYVPPSPDPSGVVYDVNNGRLVIVDGEVNEIPALFTGDNVFETDLNGNLLIPSTTLNFTSEPTGATFNVSTGHFFVTEDNNSRLFEIQRNSANNTIDFDVVRQFSTAGFGSTDPEGLTFADLGGGQKALFIAEGLNHEIYKIDPGPNGVFDGTDDIVTNFDTLSRGVNDPEGIAYNDNNFLYVVGRNDDVLTEFNLLGNVVRTCDISAVAGVKLAGLGMAPGSNNPSVVNLYIVDRGLDNNPFPNENDGRLIEISIPPLVNTAPTADAGPDRVIVLPANASLDGLAADDGLPDPPAFLTTTWTQESGPATATILSPNAEDTEVSFATDGTYVFRLTADDSVLSDFDEVSVTALPAGSNTTTLSIPISLGSDDVEEKPNGTVIIGSSDLDLVRSGGNQTIGMRFSGLTIPQGATIVDAHIQFTSKNSRSETTSLILEGEAADNAVTFVQVSGDVSIRPRTTASVSWSPPPWASAGDTGLAQRTPDLTPIVQEIVDRTGWASNNSLAIIITGTGKREADSFEANPSNAAVLTVEFN